MRGAWLLVVLGVIFWACTSTPAGPGGADAYGGSLGDDDEMGLPCVPDAEVSGPCTWLKPPAFGPYTCPANTTLVIDSCGEHYCCTAGSPDASEDATMSGDGSQSDVSNDLSRDVESESTIDSTTLDGPIGDGSTE